MRDVPQHLKGRHFVRIGGWTHGEVGTILDLADDLKRVQAAGERELLLPGRALGMIFRKPSTRTRVSFEVGIAQLGGMRSTSRPGDMQLGRGETLRDTATVLSRYLDAMMVRTFAQADVEELAAHASIPVINGLTDCGASVPGARRPDDDPRAARAALRACGSPTSATATTSATR